MKHHLRPHVLDANALLRFLSNGDGADIVERVLEKSYSAGITVGMSVINWGEVLLHMSKKVGYEQARETLAHLHPVISILPVDISVTAAAVQVQMKHGIPYADTFAAALAGTKGTLVTADRGFEKIPWLRVLWLPRYGNRADA